MDALLGRSAKAAPRAALPDLSPLAQFRARHHCVDPVLAWRKADDDARSSRAFMLIVLDPTLLDQVDAVTAWAMVRGGRDYAAALLDLGIERTCSPTLAAASFVQAAAASWLARTGLFGSGGVLPAGQPVPPDDMLQAALTEAQRTFPQYQERTAGICMLAVIELGFDGLTQLAAPELILVGASRFAAWSIGNRLKASSPARPEDAALALSLVQAWAKEHHEPVLHVPYTGRTASPAQQALSLARDASACARLAKERTDLIPREGAELWQQAAERHAYAGVALEEQSLMELDLDLATELGCNALRFATAAHGMRQEMMPRFPAGALIAGPQSVKACLRWLRQ